MNNHSEREGVSLNQVKSFMLYTVHTVGLILVAFNLRMHILVEKEEVGPKL